MAVFEQLAVEIDRSFLAAELARVRALPPTRSRVLLIASAVLKYQLNVVTWFFDHAPLRGCDLLLAEHADRALPQPPRNVRLLSAPPGPDAHYDLIVGFNTTQPLLEQCAARSTRGVFVGFPPHVPKQPPVVRLDRPITVFSTKVHSLPWDGFEACFGRSNCEQADGIDLPPNIPCHYADPPAPTIEVLLPGGGARDYGSARRHAGLFPSPIRVSHANAPLLDDDPPLDLEALGRDGRFVLCAWVRPEIYASWVVHSRVVWLPVRDTAEGDYTSAADAMWYGKPVLTQLVRANRHLADRVLLYRDAEELAAHLRLLAEPARYAQISAGVRAAARRRNSLFELLANAWRVGIAV